MAAFIKLSQGILSEWTDIRTSFCQVHLLLRTRQTNAIILSFFANFPCPRSRNSDWRVIYLNTSRAGNTGHSTKSDPIKGFRFKSFLAQRNYKQSHSTRSTITCKLDANSILLSDPVPVVFLPLPNSCWCGCCHSPLLVLCCSGCGDSLRISCSSVDK